MKASRSGELAGGEGSPVSSQRRSWAKNQGLSRAPRPMAMPAQPVVANMRAASARVRTSPLPMTGMRSTASTTLRMPSRLTLPPKPWARVRPWMVTAATPAFSNSRAK